MKKFLNFRFARRAAGFVVYALVLAMLISDIFRGPSASSGIEHQNQMTWWILFLVLDIWFFGIEDRFGSKPKND